jgi:hypothetical protein
MLEQLINLIKENAGDAIINNPAIPNEQNNDAISETASGIMNTLKGQLAGGNMEAITSLFNSGNLQNNPLVGQITSQVGGQLASKFGLDANTTGTLVAGMIPTIMQQFVHKTNDPNDNSFDMNGIMGALSEQGGAGIMDKLKGMFGA